MKPIIKPPSKKSSPFIWRPEDDVHDEQKKESISEDSDDAHDDYFAFLAEEAFNGVHPKETKRIDVPNLVSQAKVEKTGDLVDGNFWEDLDFVENDLTLRKLIVYSDGKNTCKKCRLTFKNYSELLKHCWNSHRASVKK